MVAVKWALQIKKLRLENPPFPIMEDPSKEKRRKQFNPFIKYTGLALQMGLTIYLGSLLGNYLDTTYSNQTGLYTKISTLTAVFLSIITVIRQVTRSQQ
ncbi:MAG: AtpZ/AtpI family protein [Bacteroidota bacterium]